MAASNTDDAPKDVVDEFNKQLDEYIEKLIAQLTAEAGEDK